MNLGCGKTLFCFPAFPACSLAPVLVTLLPLLSSCHHFSLCYHRTPCEPKPPHRVLESLVVTGVSLSPVLWRSCHLGVIPAQYLLGEQGARSSFAWEDQAVPKRHRVVWREGVWPPSLKAKWMVFMQVFLIKFLFTKCATMDKFVALGKASVTVYSVPDSLNNHYIFPYSSRGSKLTLMVVTHPTPLKVLFLPW